MGMMQQAREHFEAGAWAEAEAAYRKVLEEDPGQAEAMFMLAQVRQRLGDFDQPVELLDQVARLEPFNPNILHARAVLHVKRNEYDEAERYFHQALDINPNHAASRTGLAWLELATGRFEAAEHSARLTLNESPDDPQAMAYLGTALLEQGEVEEATKWLQRAVREEPGFLTAQAQLGRAFLAAGNAGFAMQCFENAMQQNPGAADLLEYLGRAQLANGLPEEALVNLRKSAEQGRANPDLYVALATCEATLGNVDYAEALLAAGLQMEPGRADLALPYAEMLLARGAAREAIAVLEPLVEAGEPAVQSLVLLSRAYVTDRATEQARTLLEPHIAAGEAPIEIQLAWIRVLEAAGEAERAQGLLEDLLEQDLPPVEARLFQARRLFRAGDERAIELLQSVVEQGGLNTPQRIVAHHQLADALHRAGRFEEAKEHYAAMAYRNAEVLRALPGPVAEGEESTLTAMDAALTATWPSQPPPDGRGEPVFVIAWPGSGQERLLVALGAHPGVTLVADPAAAQAERRSRLASPVGRTALAALDDAQVQLARGRYWKSIANQGLPTDSPVTLDTLWLGVESLPNIYRLFPQARVLVVRRDPRDMAVCWLQAGYQHLDYMAEAYGAQLRLLDRCMDAVPLHYLEADYDALEAEPRAVLAGLLEELGLPWNEAVLEAYLETPMPVIAQTGDWRHYRKSADAGPAGESDPATLH